MYSRLEVFSAFILEQKVESLCPLLPAGLLPLNLVSLILPVTSMLALYDSVDLWDCCDRIALTVSAATAQAQHKQSYTEYGLRTMSGSAVSPHLGYIAMHTVI